MDSNEINTGKQHGLESCSIKYEGNLKKNRRSCACLGDKSAHMSAATDPVITSDSRRSTGVRLPNELSCRTHLQRDTLLY